jgi:RNA polymerase sigma-70 factor (ECF subfamily)
MMRIGPQVSAHMTANRAPFGEARAQSLDLGEEPASARTAPVARPGDRDDRQAASARLDGAGADRTVVRLDESHGRAMHGFVVRLGLSADEADDAVQEVLLRLWSSLRAGVVIHDPKAWAFRTIYRLAMDAHRWRRRVDAIRLRLSPPSNPGAASDPDGSLRLSIWTEVDRLPPRQRAVLYLHYRADMTFEEAAGVMGITSGAARANATKAMVNLRRTVGSREAW